MSHREQPPEELRGIAARLAAERPRPTALELERAKRRALARAEARRPRYFPRERGPLMKPRLAVTFLLTLGLMLSGTGATLAVITDGDSAGVAQYPDLAPLEEQPGVLGVEEERPAEEVEVAPGVREAAPPAGEVAGVVEERAEAERVVQRERQIAAERGAQLPITGLAAIPILIAGLAFLTGGLVLRRRARKPADG